MAAARPCRAPPARARSTCCRPCSSAWRSLRRPQELSWPPPGLSRACAAAAAWGGGGGSRRPHRRPPRPRPRTAPRGPAAAPARHDARTLDTRSTPCAPCLGRARGGTWGMEMSSSGRMSWAQASSTMSSSRGCPSRMMQAIGRHGLLPIVGRLSSSQPHAWGRHGTAPLASGPRRRTRTAASSQPSPALPTRRQKGLISAHGSDTKAP